MKKLISILIAIAMILTLTSAFAENIPVIGINQFAQHPSLDNCRDGFLQGLANAGLVEGEDFTVSYQNAGADPTLAGDIAQSFVSNRVALMCGIATPSAMACYNATEEVDIPVVFTAITDPVSAGLTEGNITGTSDKLSVDEQLALIRALQPDATSIGIIYTTSEPGSVTSVAEYEEKAANYGFTIETVGVTSHDEVTQAADTLIGRGVDCFTNLLDNTVVDMLTAVLEKTDEAGIPIYGSEVEQVINGCVAASGIDYILLGIQTGEMAARILKGEATAEEMPYETISEYSLYVNPAVLAQFDLEMPAEVAEVAVIVGTDAE